MKSTLKRRPACPVSVSLNLLGDRWSLIVVRDLKGREYRTCREFLHSGEGFATRIFSDRLQELAGAGILTAGRTEDDGRSTLGCLAGNGIDLDPVLVELFNWTAHPKLLLKTLSSRSP